MTYLQLLLRLCAIVSTAALAGGGWLLGAWVVREQQLRALFPDGRYHHNPAALILGGLLLAWALLGAVPARRLFGRSRLEAPYAPGPGRHIEAEDGTRLWVESYGDEHAPALILTHAWGLDSSLWRDAKAQLSQRFRVIVWDLPGHGRSGMPGDGRLSLERMSDQLKTVLALANGPALLVGHSIGGMIVLTLCGRLPSLAAAKVAGIVLEHTTYTDPVRTTRHARLLRPLEAPVLRPLLWLDIVLAPLVRLMNGVGYLSGMTHLAMRYGAFGPKPSRTLLETVSRLAATQSPAVQAKGALAMMDWDYSLELLRIRQSAHVFIGGEDRVTCPEAGSAIASGILGAYETRVPHAGHFGPIECPSFYDHAIAAFADAELTRGAAWADQPAAAGRPLDSDRSFEPEHRTPPAAPGAHPPQA